MWYQTAEHHWGVLLIGEHSQEAVGAGEEPGDCWGTHIFSSWHQSPLCARPRPFRTHNSATAAATSTWRRYTGVVGRYKSVTYTWPIRCMCKTICSKVWKFNYTCRNFQKVIILRPHLNIVTDNPTKASVDHVKQQSIEKIALGEKHKRFAGEWAWKECK